MKCDVCSGEGTVPQDYPPGTDLHIRQVTCRRCGGSGKARCGIVGPVEGMHQDGACVLEPQHGGPLHRNASGNEWPVKTQQVETRADAVARWRTYGRDMLSVIESDSNAGGLEDYIEELRGEIKMLREGRDLVLGWVGKQGCHCEAEDPDDLHTGACPGVAEVLLKLVDLPAPPQPAPKIAKKPRVRRTDQGYIRAPGDCKSGECGTCNGCLVRSME